MENLNEYFVKDFKKDYIKPSILPAGYPIFFVPKRNGKLRLYVNYKQLNDITIKDCYPLPLIGEFRNIFYQTQRFTILNFKKIYNIICINKGEEWKIVFRTRRRYCEYLGILFGFINAPATF